MESKDLQSLIKIEEEIGNQGYKIESISSKKFHTGRPMFHITIEISRTDYQSKFPGEFIENEKC